MRRLILALFLLPAASAQVALEPGPLEVEQVRASPMVFPLSHGQVQLEVRYDCRDYDLAMEDLRVRVAANATTRTGWTVPLDYASSHVVDLDGCRWTDQVVYLDVDLGFTTPDYDLRDVLDVQVRLQLESPEGLVERPGSEPVHASTSIPMLLEEPVEEEGPIVTDVAAEEAAVSDEYAPGSGLPLLLGAVAVMGRLRRR